MVLQTATGEVEGSDSGSSQIHLQHPQHSDSGDLSSPRHAYVHIRGELLKECRKT